MSETASAPPDGPAETAREAAVRAARAEQVRAEIPPAMVGVAAVAVVTIFVGRSFAGSVDPALLRWWLIAMAATPVSLVLAFVFTRLWPPDDATVLRFWRPWGRTMRFVMNLPVLISPWILLPEAEPMLRVIMVVLYVWFMATQVLANTDPHGLTFVALFGLPASAGAFLIVNDLPYAVPLAAFLALIGGSLFLLERLLIKMRLQAMERDVEQRLAKPAPAPSPATENLALTIAMAHPARPPVPTNPVNTGLTRRQIEVLRLLAQGLSNKEIARELDISPATVKTHVADIIAITGAPNRTGAAMQAQAMGLVPATTTA